MSSNGTLTKPAAKTALEDKLKSEWEVLGPSGRTATSSRMKRGRNLMLFRSNYAGASRDNTLGDWRPPRNSADEVLKADRQELISRQRDLRRNDPMVAGAILKMVQNIIGTGIRAQADIDGEALGLSPEATRDLEKAIDREWARWIQEADYAGNEGHRKNFYDIQLQILESWIDTGAAVAFPRYLERPGYRYRFCLQVLETDRINTPSDKQDLEFKTRGAERVVDGVKIGKRGEIEGIYVQKTHPGEQTQFASKEDYEYFPAVDSLGRARFWLLFKEDRPEQHMGEPRFASSIAGHRTFNTYLGAEVTRANMAAAFGIAILTETPYDDMLNMLGVDPTEDQETDPRFPGGVSNIENWAAGSVYRGFPGDKLETVNPNLPGDNFEVFTERVATLLGAPVGLTRELMLNTFDKSNFSNTRLSLEESRRYFRMVQRWIIAHLVEPIRLRFLEDAWTLGLLNLPQFLEKADIYAATEYMPAGWPYMDPMKDAQAADLRLKSGTTNLRMECAEQGRNWRTVLEQRKKELDFMDSIGLELEPVEALPFPENEGPPEDDA